MAAPVATPPAIAPVALLPPAIRYRGKLKNANVSHVVQTEIEPIQKI